MTGDPGLAWSDHVDFADIPLAHSTGLTFVAAALTLADIGVTATAPGVLNAGGCAEDRALAHLKCTGELAEKLAILDCGPATRPPVAAQADVDADVAALRDHVHLLSALDLPTGDGDDGVPGINLQNRRAISLPRGFVYRQADKPHVYQAGSNGCAAGDDFDSALARAVLELVERDAVTLWWYGRRPASSAHFMPDAARDITGFLSRIRPDAARPVTFLNLTTDIPVPVIAAISHDGGGRHCAIGFGADLSPSAAAVKAVCEMSQMELAYDLAMVKNGMARPLTGTDRNHLARLARYTMDGSTPLADIRNAPSQELADGPVGPDRLVRILSCLFDLGYGVYAVDMSPETDEHTIVRAIVPGLQSPDIAARTGRLTRMLHATGCRLQDAVTPGPY